jgi:hypothetical protein
MDLSSKDFSLNFRGFEHDDPETVERFTAFCRANFSLSPDNFGGTGAHSDTVVLTHGESHEELEALAKVLREIGARVDVSKKNGCGESDPFTAPSTQELHRLFGHHQEEGGIEGVPSCPYPPLGRTLYVFTNSDEVFDRGRLRHKGTRIADAQPQATSESRKGSSLLVLSIVSMTIGFVALAAAALLLKGYPTSPDVRTERNFGQSRSLNEPMRSEGSAQRGARARTLSANGSVGGFTIDIKVLASESALSISSLTLSPIAQPSANEARTIKRIVGDPTFLSEGSAGEWRGSVLLSVFTDENGQASHVTIPAEVVVKIDKEHAVGSAMIEVTSAAFSGAAGTEALQGLLVTDLTLS